MGSFDSRAFAEDGGRWFCNSYECPCGAAWSDSWSCACDDDCPECGTTCEPSDSEDVTADYQDELRDLICKMATAPQALLDALAAGAATPEQIAEAQALLNPEGTPAHV